MVARFSAFLPAEVTGLAHHAAPGDAASDGAVHLGVIAA